MHKEYIDNTAQKLIVGIGFLILEIWMVTSANKKDKNLLSEK